MRHQKQATKKQFMKSKRKQANQKIIHKEKRKEIIQRKKIELLQKMEETKSLFSQKDKKENCFQGNEQTIQESQSNGSFDDILLQKQEEENYLQFFNFQKIVQQIEEDKEIMGSQKLEKERKFNADTKEYIHSISLFKEDADKNKEIIDIFERVRNSETIEFNDDQKQIQDKVDQLNQQVDKYRKIIRRIQNNKKQTKGENLKKFQEIQNSKKYQLPNQEEQNKKLEEKSAEEETSDEEEEQNKKNQDNNLERLSHIHQDNMPIIEGDLNHSFQQFMKEFSQFKSNTENDFFEMKQEFRSEIKNLKKRMTETEIQFKKAQSTLEKTERKLEKAYYYISVLNDTIQILNLKIFTLTNDLEDSKRTHETEILRDQLISWLFHIASRKLGGSKEEFHELRFAFLKDPIFKKEEIEDEQLYFFSISEWEELNDFKEKRNEIQHPSIQSLLKNKGKITRLIQNDNSDKLSLIQKVLRKVQENMG